MAETFKEDPSAAKAFTFTEDAGASAAFGVKPKSRYADPKSFSQTDEEVGAETGAIKTLRVPGIGGIIEGQPEPIGRHAREAFVDEVAGGMNRVELAAATSALGGLAGAGVKAATAAKPATAIGTNALSAFAKAGKGTPIAETISNALGKTVEHSIIARGIQLVLPSALTAAGKVGAAGIKGAASLAPAAGTVAGGVAGKAASEPVTEEDPAPFRGTMHNAIERLRASAEGNPRAAELLSRIEGIQSPAGVVTQSEGVH